MRVREAIFLIVGLGIGRVSVSPSFTIGQQVRSVLAAPTRVTAPLSPSALRWLTELESDWRDAVGTGNGFRYDSIASGKSGHFILEWQGGVTREALALSLKSAHSFFDKTLGRGGRYRLHFGVAGGLSTVDAYVAELRFAHFLHHELSRQLEIPLPFFLFSAQKSPEGQSLQMIFENPYFETSS